MSLIIKCLNWPRKDNNGMYDFSSKEDKVLTILKIQNSGVIMRNINNNLMYFFKGPPFQRVNNKDEYEKLVLIQLYSNGRFKILDLFPKSQPLCKVISSFQQKTNEQIGIDLVESDIFKIGKVRVSISKLQRIMGVKNLYQQLKMPEISKQFHISKIIPEDYQGNLVQASFIQQCDTCRYCFCKSVTTSNPMLGGLCKCVGSHKFAHVQCLIQWIKKRANMVDDEKKGIYFGQLKGFQCQICKFFFPAHQIYPFLIGKKPFQEYIVLKVSLKQQLVYIINLENQEKECKIRKIQIGRSNECDIVVNELSVSRKHCRLQFDFESKRLKLYDLNSKFGTVVVLQKDLLDKGGTYQKGRSLLYIQNVEEKTSFWGNFCTTKQDLSSGKRYNV